MSGPASDRPRDSGRAPRHDSGATPKRDPGVPPTHDPGVLPRRDFGVPPRRDSGVPQTPDSSVPPRRDPEGELVEAMASFRHDPLGFVRFAFPWGEAGTELEGESGPRQWQADILAEIGAALAARHAARTRGEGREARAAGSNRALRRERATEGGVTSAGVAFERDQDGTGDVDGESFIASEAPMGATSGGGELPSPVARSRHADLRQHRSSPNDVEVADSLFSQGADALEGWHSPHEDDEPHVAGSSRSLRRERAAEGVTSAGVALERDEDGTGEVDGESFIASGDPMVASSGGSGLPPLGARSRHADLRQHRSSPEDANSPDADLAGALRIAVASGHGIGKSALVAWTILWALCTLPHTRATVTANTGDQIRTKTWPEVAKWFNLLICRHWFAFEAGGIRARSEISKTPEVAKTWRCDAVTWSETNTSAFVGLHNKGRRLLLVFDEASEIADRVWEVAQGAMTDAGTELLWLAFGNPTSTTGRFRECFPGGRFAHRWRARQIDSRSVAGTGAAEIAQWVEDWGEDSDFVRVRVRGQFPRGGSLQFIDGETVERAARREATSHLRQPVILGVDVARFGDDQQVIAARRGLDARTIPLRRYRGLDLVTFSAQVAEAALVDNARAVFIDAGGMGAGVVDMVRAMLPGRFVAGVNFGGRADRHALGAGRGAELPLTADKAAEMWASLRHWLQDGAIPDDAELKAELTGRQYGFDTHSAIRLERKEDMKKRGLASPDVADALALTFAWPVADLPDHLPVGTAGTGYGGGYGGSGGYGYGYGGGAEVHHDDYDPHAEA